MKFNDMVKNEKKDCCGCTACENICPKQAITMKADEEGFLYPFIDYDLCTNCNLCRNICEFNEQYDKNSLLNSQLIYAVKHKNINERCTSQSGGMFVALADYILSIEGSIYGVSYDEKWKICYKRVTKQCELKELKGSKYVQSDLKNTFKQVKSDLINKKYVLFTSTPCFVAGLKSYLGELAHSEKLYLCDIVCHGTPSPLMWNEYLKFIKHKYGNDILKVNFRDMSYGWRVPRESFLFKDKKITLKYWGDLFYENIMLRPSCEKCHFCNFNRPSDITIGDFWGIEKTMPELDDDKGISLCIVNTLKGKRLFKLVSNKLDYRKSSKQDCVQPNLISPTYIPSKRKQFWEEYCEKGFIFILKKYSEYGIKNRVLRKSKRFIKKIIKHK